MRKHLVYITTIVLLACSCNGPDYTRELATIDSLKKVVTSTDSILTALNQEDISKKAAEISNNKKYIQFNVNVLKDTLDFKTAEMLSEYREVGKFYDKILLEGEYLKKSVDSAKVSLDNLAHDLANKSLAEGIDVKASIENEKNQVAEMNAYTQNLAQLYVNARASYDTLMPKVSAYVRQMNDKLAEKEKK